MRCEIIGVGTELLLGQIVNTNAAWIGQRLADVGWDCLRHTAVGDNTERIAEAIREALGRADAVLLTGGLGPTQDDVTREALAEVAGVALVRQPELEAWLRERFGGMGVQRMAEMNLRQADVPEGARTIDNPRGTAPGLIVEGPDITWSARFVAALAFAGLVGTAAAWSLWFGLVAAGEAGRAASYIFFVPLVGVVVGAVLLDETLTASLLVGAALVVLGVYLVNRRQASS